MLLMGIVLVAVALPIGFLIPGFVDFVHVSPTIAPSQVSGQVFSNLSPWLTLILSFFLTAAQTLFEEALFRGLIQKMILLPRILKNANPVIALVSQATLFGAVHAFPLLGASSTTPIIIAWVFCYPALAGLFLGYVSYYYNSILPSWYIHWGSNFLAAILAVLAPSLTW